MDYLKGFFLWPLVTAGSYALFAAGCVTSSLPVLVHLLQGKGLVRFVDIWSALRKAPLGNIVFSGIVGFYAPYTSSISPIVLDLKASECTVSMEDRPWLRNPFGSIHAIALANLGEFASGLSVISAMQTHKHLRGIPTSVSMDFLKKARGTIVAKSSVSLEGISEDCDIQVLSMLYDSKNTLVAKFTATWSLRVKTAKQG